MTKTAKSKVDTVIVLCKCGTTLAAIAKRLRISKTAAASLVADARRKGAKVKFDEGRYYL